MAYQKLNQADDIRFAARYKSNEKQCHPALNLATDGFDTWWKKTFAQHMAMVAQASSLMRSHRQVPRLASLESGKPFDHTASQIAVLLIAGAVVTEEMIQLRDTIRDVLFSNAVDYIEMFSGVKVIEA